jgi:glycosyltransferase involved in cell wall biosynthesis
MNARRRVKETLSASNTDVVHVHGMNYLTTTAVLRGVPADCPTVLHQHTPFVEYPLPFEVIEKINDRTVGRWNLRHADRVFCVSENIERYVNSISNTVNTDLMLNGVDTDRFHPSNDADRLREASDATGPMFFSLSRLSQKKGIDVLLEAARILEQRDRQVRIVVAGDGPMREDVVEATERSDILEYVGRVSEEELPEFYATADGFLFTSRSGEAFPTLTMMEAYASGTPVVASDLVAEPMGVTDGTNSVLVEPGNPDELAHAIADLAANQEQLDRMGRSSRETAERRFSIEDRIDRLETCYESLLGDGN